MIYIETVGKNTLLKLFKELYNRCVCKGSGQNMIFKHLKNLWADKSICCRTFEKLACHLFPNDLRETYNSHQVPKNMNKA